MTGADGQTIDVMANLKRQRAERHRHRSESAAVDTAPGKPAGESKADGVAAETTGAPKGRSEDAKRWNTLNEFEDCVARHLTPAEQIVWHHLFRHCREGRSSVSTRGMAEVLGVAPNTATASLRWLKDRRLIWEIVKSTHRGASSIYGLHQNPGRLADACAAANEPRLTRRNRTPPRRPKPR